LIIEEDRIPPDAVKDETAQHPVAGSWRPSLRKVVQAFVRGDYGLSASVLGVEDVSEETREQIREYIADYGATLVELPEKAWKTSVAQWMGTHWDVLVDLWTAEEGRSDLVLSCKVYESDQGYRIALYMVYVP
jgi:hypothetical protein